MKILLYNWVQFDQNDGGGVTVYLKNIINDLVTDEDVEVYFLSSGTNFNLFSKKVKVKQTKNLLGDKVKSYTIYNSPVLFAHNQFSRVDIYNNDKTLVDVIDNFIEKNEGFDVIHFNNLEGISVEVLKLKEKYKKTKFIYSMHNYFPICPNVYLWSHDCENCKNYEQGKKCCGCIESSYSKAILAQKISTFFKKFNIDTNSPKMKKIYTKIKKILKIKNKDNKDNKENNREIDYSNADDYRIFREKNVEYINKYVDEVLCVSKRVLEIAVKYGIDREKCYVSYIGTKFANNLTRQKIDINSKDFNFIYLGYMNKMKGFDFLIESLNKLDNNRASNINLTLVCRNNSDYDIKEILNNLKKKFKSVKYVDGYTHDNLKDLLEGQHLGVIPVVWEDNLPQVSIEVTSFGVPILCSDLGGASELCDDDSFRFIGNNTEDFIKKLESILDDRNKLLEFWDKYNKPTKMEEHIKELYSHYGIK